jgi:xanthine/uracil permease
MAALIQKLGLHDAATRRQYGLNVFLGLQHLFAMMDATVIIPTKYGSKLQRKVQLFSE